MNRWDLTRAYADSPPGRPDWVARWLAGGALVVALVVLWQLSQPPAPAPSTTSPAAPYVSPMGGYYQQQAHDAALQDQLNRDRRDRSIQESTRPR